MGVCLFSLLIFVLLFKKCFGINSGFRLIGLSRWCSGKEPAYQYKRCRRPGLDLWVRKIPWRRKWHPTPVFLPGKSHGDRSLVIYGPQGLKELDSTEHACPLSRSNIQIILTCSSGVWGRIFLPLGHWNGRGTLCIASCRTAPVGQGGRWDTGWLYRSQSTFCLH